MIFIKGFGKSKSFPVRTQSGIKESRESLKLVERSSDGVNMRTSKENATGDFEMRPARFTDAERIFAMTPFPFLEAV